MGDRPNEASFLGDVAAHEMTVLRDDGLYRHVRFQDPKTCNCYFDLTTWPGYLTFSGDMGCFVFSRIPDMFQFFRIDNVPGSPFVLRINPYYWSEKVEAVDHHGAIEKYSPELFKRQIARWLDNREASANLRDAVEEEVLTHADDEHDAMRAAMEFEHEGFRFEDFYEVEVKEYTYRFLWCCYAVAWGVRTYDERAAASMPG